MIEDLLDLADDLDKLGLSEASDDIDQILKEAAKKKSKSKKRVPTNKKLWARALAEARKKFDVFPCVPVSNSFALTESGWKSFYDLNVDDKIISYNKNKNCLEWDVIKHLHFYKEAETIRLYKKNGSFDFICTKDHKWVIKNKEKKSNKKYKYEDQLVKTEDINKSMNLITSARMENSYPLSLSDLRNQEWSWTEKVIKMSNQQREAWLIAAIAGNGHEDIYEYLNNLESSDFSQKNEDYKNAIFICAVLLGYSVSEKYNSEFLSFKFKNKQTHNTKNLLKENFNECDVWCPETNNGTWLMKQDELITITGNSAYANGWAVQWYKKHGGGWKGPKPMK